MAPDKGLGLAKCEKCSKLFGRQEPGQSLCSDCLAEASGMSRSQRRGLSEKEETLSHDLAMLAGFSQGAVEDAFIAQNKRDMLGEGRLCPKCKERRVEEGEEYCWNCQVDLFQSFRKAASEIKQDSEKAKKARSQSSESTSMLIQLQEKMARTGSNRTNMLDTRPTRY